MEIPKEDKKHVLRAMLKSNGIYHTIAFTMSSLLWALMLGFIYAWLLTPFNPVALLLGGPWVMFCLTFMIATWPFSVGRKEWLMWKATTAEA